MNADDVSWSTAAKYIVAEETIESKIKDLWPRNGTPLTHKDIVLIEIAIKLMKEEMIR